MTGMNTSVSAGWYTFANLGPLTTTFTPAPSCTASNRIVLGYLNPDVYIEFATQCTSSFNYVTDCIPTTTTETTVPPTPTFTATSYEDYVENRIDWAGFGAYYSPGLYCPSGWTTVGMAARDASSSLTSSGVLVPTETTTTTKYSTDDFYYYMFDHEYPASVLKSMLEPRQTMALCCPSAMTADNNGGCYSIVKDYTPSFGCQVATGYNYKYSSAPYTYTYSSADITHTGYRRVPTETVYETDTYRTRLDPEQTYLTAMSYGPLITLLHHESDLQSAGTSTTASATAGTTSNAAGRVVARVTSWDGFAPVLGIWSAAMALGAAIIIPW